MQIDVLESRDSVQVITSEWDELAKYSGEDGLFRSPGWYFAWLEHINRQARPTVVTIRNGRGRLIGLAPLVTMRYRDLGFRVSALGFGGREVVSADYLGFLADSECRAQVTTAILDRVCGLKWNILLLGELVVGSSLHLSAELWAEQAGLTVRRQEFRTCPYIRLPAAYDQFLSTLSESFRYNVRRKTREVVQKQGGAIERLSEPTQVAASIPILVKLHVQRWRSSGYPGTLWKPGVGAFLKAICGSQPCGSRSRMYLLNFRGEYVAALLMFYCGEKAYYYQTGWNPDSPLSRHSPGVVLMARSIEDAIDEGFQYYDFLRGSEAYKSHWTQDGRGTITLAIGRDRKANLYLAATFAKDSLKSALKLL